MEAQRPGADSMKVVATLRIPFTQEDGDAIRLAPLRIRILRESLVKLIHHHSVTVTYWRCAPRRRASVPAAVRKELRMVHGWRESARLVTATSRLPDARDD